MQIGWRPVPMGLLRFATFLGEMIDFSPLTISGPLCLRSPSQRHEARRPQWCAEALGVGPDGASSGHQPKGRRLLRLYTDLKIDRKADPH